MVGYGPEDDHFVAELTYNYGVGEYQLGNDFLVGESSFGLLHKGQWRIRLCSVKQHGRYLCLCFSRQGITLVSSRAVSNAKRLGWPLTEVEDALYLTQAPGGYPFYLVDKEQPLLGECLKTSNLSNSERKWVIEVENSENATFIKLFKCFTVLHT